MLEFDAETAKLLEVAYAGADFTARRRFSFDALAPGPGDHVADIGCGNGLFAAELARAVGPDGQVTGIDPSAAMRAPAEARVADFSQARIVEGTAEALPLADASLDGAVSLQVFEYLENIPAALREAARVLKPGGRLVIGDMLFDTLLWLSDEPERMARMIRSWAAHVTENNLPASLPRLMTDAGFRVDLVAPFTYCDHRLRPDGLARMMLILMERYAAEKGHVPAEEARAWTEEQEAMSREGRFFFSLTHVVVRGVRL